ncbi:hypothetical protein AM493_13090 [Flavobacterium akiainvivens]|uniref:Bax inhibitor-1/YccA family protein n=1 Tax=Flavobacterium akiainvivens TaxID=1202724 RepID=A0A0M8MJJ1_9FLAO|nr:Bax inhibitor-1/YccA family protein [Flavobacterium akiainvivens]KOS06858.1 hypothetical protein AM493_13090 [Flavobacterium akiainvivens]SFQ69223.1 Uncharacterized membrane protein, YccA/Bax inhibitor family [Flavobacterium akiainvivens]
MQQQSNNPFFKNKEFNSAPQTTYYNADGSPANVIDYNDTMTVNGAMAKTAILFGLLLAGALVPFYLIAQGMNFYTPAIVSFVIALIIGLSVGFAPKQSRYLAPAYALFEGVVIGSISILFEVYVQPGIVLQAVGGTFVTFIVCLLLYRFRVVNVTERFKSVVIAATMALFIYYLVSMVVSWAFGITLFHHGNSLISIGFSIFVIVLAALNLFLDFDMIEEGAERRLPKYMEWFSAMGLMMTMIWLYLEFLKLLAKLNRD